MAAFNYTALDAKGQEHKGVQEGDSARQVRQTLRDQGLTPIEVETVHGDNAFSHKKTEKVVRKNRQSLKTAEVALFTRQMATLLAAGLPMEEVLRGVAEQTEKPRIKSMVIAIRSKVLEGHTLAMGLREFPKAFSELYCATVAAGEEAGHLDHVLVRLADYSEKQQHTQQKIKQAMIYPSIMTVVSILIVVFLLIYVVPKMVSVFTDTKQALPLATSILLAVSGAIEAVGLYVIAGFILAGFIFKRMLRQDKVRYAFHQFLLRVPIIGNAIKVINTARFARTFGILSSAGVSVLEAMRVSASLVTNMPMHEAIQEATAKVREGANIHRALKQTKYFPPMSIHLIASGESTGQLEAMLERAADNQDQDVTNLIENILTLFEPVIILIMGAIVLFIVMAIMLPIFNLNQFAG